MTLKRLRSTCIALAAGCAIAAITAASASAGTFKAESYPATITGEQTTQVVFTGVVGAWKCNKLTMQGELGGESGSLNLAPTYSECSWAGVGATTSMEGCTYEFKAGSTVEGENKISATMNVNCPAGKEVKLVLNGGTCTIFIPEQANLGSVTAENNLLASPIDVKLKLTLSSITYRVENGFLGCPNNPANGTYTNGTIAGEVTLKADASGKQVAFRVA
jgi:hypothetical protein